MSDDFEARVVAWMREAARPDPTLLSSMRGMIDVLPARRRGRRRGWLLATAALLAVMAVGLSSIILSPRPNGSAATGPSHPAPPDPAAFAGDVRLNLCGSGPEAWLAVFEMAHLTDYQRHLPKAYPLIGLTGDQTAPALVAVYAGPPSVGRLPQRSPGTSSRGPNDHDLCLVVGTDRASWRHIGVADVDTTGLIAVSPLNGAPAPSTAASPASPPSPSGDQPAPAWTADLGGQLECDEPAPVLGGEVGHFGAWEPGPTPDGALQLLLDTRVFASFPARGFDPAVVDGHWARHVYRVDERIRALAVTTDRADGFPAGDGWHVVGIRGCDAAEFDPADGLTFDQTLWLDATDKFARSETIHSSPGPGHCGWESVVFLRFEGVQYLRDPLGVLAGRTVVPFDHDVSLPGSASDSGYHISDWHLFKVPAGDAVYVRTTDGTFERWGRARELVACA